MSDKNWDIGYKRANDFLNSDEFKNLAKEKLKLDTAKRSTRSGINAAVSDNIGWDFVETITGN